eukprot:130771_1
MSTSKYQKELIVYGYIRAIEPFLDKNKIIPSSIVIICYNFFLMTKNIFVRSNEKNEFILFDITSNTIRKIASRIQLNGTRVITLRYIPCISNLFSHKVLSPNKIYDGIICQMFHADNYGYYHYLFIYELSECDKDLIYYETFRSTLSCKKICEYIYCGEPYGIMINYNDNEDENYTLMRLDKIQFLHINKSVQYIRSHHRRRSSLSLYVPKQMVFMNGVNKLFWVQGQSRFAINSAGLKYGLYDLNTRKSSELGTIDIYNAPFQFLCYNDRNNAICLLTGKNNVIKYDVNEDKWYTFLGFTNFDNILMLFLCENLLFSVYTRNDKDWKCENCGSKNDKTYIICTGCFADNGRSIGYNNLSFKYVDIINGLEWKDYQTDIGDNIRDNVSVRVGSFFC